MTLDLSKAKTLCEAATCLSCSGTGLLKRPNWTSIICSQCGGSGVREEFVKAARSLVPALIAECERLGKEVLVLRHLVKRIDETLRVPAAEYVPAIGDVFSLIDALATDTDLRSSGKGGGNG